MCRHPRCERVVVKGRYYCTEHDKPHLRQSTDVSPKLAARNRMVLAGECYVYAVDGGDSVKFGKAMDVDARFSSLQTGSPVDLVLLGSVLGPNTLEKEIHKWAKPHHKRGEWFVKADPVLRLVELIKAGKVEPVLALLRNKY